MGAAVPGWEVAAELVLIPGFVGARRQRVRQHVGCSAHSVIAYLPPACDCLSEAINSCSLFSKSP